MNKLFCELFENQQLLNQEQKELNNLESKYFDSVIAFKQLQCTNSNFKQLHSKFLNEQIIQKLCCRKPVEFADTERFLAEIPKNRIFEIIEIEYLIGAKHSTAYTKFISDLRTNPNWFNGFFHHFNEQIIEIIFRNIFNNLLNDHDVSLARDFCLHFIRFSKNRISLDNQTFRQILYMFHFNLKTTNCFRYLTTHEVVDSLVSCAKDGNNNNRRLDIVEQFIRNLTANLICIPQQLLDVFRSIKNCINKFCLLSELIYIELIAPALIFPECFGVWKWRLSRHVRCHLVELANDLLAVFRQESDLKIQPDLLNGLFVALDEILSKDVAAEACSSTIDSFSNSNKYLIFYADDLNFLLNFFRTYPLSIPMNEYLPKAIDLSKFTFRKKPLLSISLKNIRNFAENKLEDKDEEIEMENETAENNENANESDNCDNSSNSVQSVAESEPEPISAIEDFTNAEPLSSDLLAVNSSKKRFFSKFKLNFVRRNSKSVTESSDNDTNSVTSIDLDSILNKYRNKKIDTISENSSDILPDTSSACNVSFDGDFDVSESTITVDNFENSCLFKNFFWKFISVLREVQFEKTLSIKSNETVDELLQLQLVYAKTTGNRQLETKLNELIRCLTMFDQNPDVRLLLMPKLVEKINLKNTEIQNQLNASLSAKREKIHYLNKMKKMKQEIEIENYRILDYFIGLNVGRMLWNTYRDKIEEFVNDFNCNDTVHITEKAEKFKLFRKELESNVFDHDSIWSDFEVSDISIGKRVLETTLFYEIYESALLPAKLIDTAKDRLFCDHVKKLRKQITPQSKYLQIDKIFLREQPWTEAQQILKRLSSLMNPHDKLKCVTDCISTLNNLLSMSLKKRLANADDLIPVLIYVIIMANPDSMLSTVQFVNNFSSDLDGEQGCCWTQFCSVIEFIKTMNY